MKKSKLCIGIIVLIILCLQLEGCASLEEKGTTSGTNANEFVLRIDAAFKDRLGNVILNGFVNQPAAVYAEGSGQLTIVENYFAIMADWDVGEPITVRAENNEGITKEIEFWPDREPPDEPTGLRLVRATPNLIEIEWDGNLEPDIKGYEVHYGLKNGNMREVPNLITDNKYEAIGLKNFVKGNHRTFQFYLYAVDLMGNESYDHSDVLEVVLP